MTIMRGTPFLAGLPFVLQNLRLVTHPQHLSLKKGMEFGILRHSIDRATAEKLSRVPDHVIAVPAVPEASNRSGHRLETPLSDEIHHQRLFFIGQPRVHRQANDAVADILRHRAVARLPSESPAHGRQM